MRISFRARPRSVRAHPVSSRCLPSGNLPDMARPQRSPIAASRLQDLVREINLDFRRELVSRSRARSVLRRAISLRYPSIRAAPMRRNLRVILVATDRARRRASRTGDATDRPCHRPAFSQTGLFADRPFRRPAVSQKGRQYHVRTSPHGHRLPAAAGRRRHQPDRTGAGVRWQAERQELRS